MFVERGHISPNRTYARKWILYAKVPFRVQFSNIILKKISVSIFEETYSTLKLW